MARSDKGRTRSNNLICFFMTYPRYFVERTEFRTGGDFCYWSLDDKGNIRRHWNGRVTEQYWGTS